MCDQELLKEIDVTIDRLIENAEAIEGIAENKKLFLQEIELLESAQESLIAHLIHLNGQLEAPLPTKALSVNDLKNFSIEDIAKVSSKANISKEKLKLRKSRTQPNKQKAIA